MLNNWNKRNDWENAFFERKRKTGIKAWFREYFPAVMFLIIVFMMIVGFAFLLETVDFDTECLIYHCVKVKGGK